MRIFTVSFFGHRILDDPFTIERQLEPLIRKLLREKEYVEFLVGRDGEYDQIVSSTIRRCKRNVRSDNSSHIWVLPYMTSEFRSNEALFLEYYDAVEICDTAAQGHFMAAYQRRNREMADRSDLVIFSVHHRRGGAWQTLQYTQRSGIPYINLADSR